MEKYRSTVSSRYLTAVPLSPRFSQSFQRCCNVCAAGSTAHRVLLFWPDHPGPVVGLLHLQRHIYHRKSADWIAGYQSVSDSHLQMCSDRTASSIAAFSVSAPHNRNIGFLCLQDFTDPANGSSGSYPEQNPCIGPRHLFQYLSPV